MNDFIGVIDEAAVYVSDLPVACPICGKRIDTGDENFCDACLLEMDLGVINEKKI